MKLAKDFIDIGIHTNRRDEMLSFWGSEVGLPYDELLKTGGGNHQHRHDLNGAIFKLNHSRNPLPDAMPTGYSKLYVARQDLSEPVELVDPDGNAVCLVPVGYNDIDSAAVEMTVSSISKFSRFYTDALGMTQVDDFRWRWGKTQFLLRESPDHGFCDQMRGIGYRYITVQVWDVDAEHQYAVAHNSMEGSSPTTLGTTARISFIRDPDGNWIEISQRASLTGSLDSADDQ